MALIKVVFIIAVDPIESAARYTPAACRKKGMAPLNAKIGYCHNWLFLG